MTKKSRFTIPVDEGTEKIALELIEKWGADALRNSDGTKITGFFENLGLKVYATYFPTRNDQKWAYENKEEAQQIYLLSKRCVAEKNDFEISLLDGYFNEQFEINETDFPHTYWQVIDRTENKIVDISNWDYISERKSVKIKNAKLWHIYTVGFLARQIWDVTQMYNHITNNWGDKVHEIPYDPAFKKTREHILEDLEKWLKDHEHVDVVRFTTFFYHFTVMYDNLKKQKFGDWFGYSASISSADIKAFEEEYGYKLNAEDIIDEGYYNTAYRVPSKKFLDYIEHKQKFVSSLAKECIDLVHKYNKEAMMFIGDNWIGTEPFGKYFSSMGLDAVVGSTSSGAGIRMISDIQKVKYREVRFLPYFFPDVFNDQGDPVGEASSIWIKSRRALAINLLDRIGYGGYLSLAYKYKNFVERVEKITDQFNEFHNTLQGTKVDLLPIKIGILNAWGSIKAWQCNTTGHVSGAKESAPFRGVFEAISGMPFEIEFINFSDIKNGALDNLDIILNIGTAGTAWSGGENWKDEEVVSKIREFVYNKGKAFLGIGDPSACQFGGAYFQLSDIMGVEKETENTINFSKHDKLYINKHFVNDGLDISNIDLGFVPRNIYGVSDNLKILSYDKIDGIKIAVNECSKGRGAYMSGCLYNATNSRLLYRLILWLTKKEELINYLYSDNINIDFYSYSQKNLILLLNNSLSEQEATVVINQKELNIKIESMGMKFINI